MKIASFNVENLFERVKAMSLETSAETRAVLNDYAEANSLLAKPAYSTADKKRILAILKKYKLQKSGESDLFILRENRGHLLQKETSTKPAAIVADGRGDWIGWLELKTGPVNAAAISNTGRVMSDVNADILAVIEAEDRPSLMRFNKIVLAEFPDAPYYHVMLIDGNDERGIDVGIMTREAYPITAIASHVDDHDAQEERIFSRDCAGYRVELPSGKHMWVLVNHLKSKGYGDFAKSNAKRKKQAARIREIYDTLVQTDPLIAVVGDMNDTPDSDPLAPLFQGGALQDVSSHPNFDDGGRPGTYANGAKSNKIDYVLCSPALFDKMIGGGIFRQGVWGGVNGDLFPHYDSISKPVESASDHAAIWGEFDV